MSDTCQHVDQIQVDISQVDDSPGAQVCQQCLDKGDTWVNLRMCLICGQVGCCDSSKNKHATKHYHATGHPLILDVSEGQRWIYCYADDTAFHL